MDNFPRKIFGWGFFLLGSLYTITQTLADVRAEEMYVDLLKEFCGPDADVFISPADNTLVCAAAGPSETTIDISTPPASEKAIPTADQEDIGKVEIISRDPVPVSFQIVGTSQQLNGIPIGVTCGEVSHLLYWADINTLVPELNPALLCQAIINSLPIDPKFTPTAELTATATVTPTPSGSVTVTVTATATPIITTTPTITSVASPTMKPAPAPTAIVSKTTPIPPKPTTALPTPIRSSTPIQTASATKTPLPVPTKTPKSIPTLAPASTVTPAPIQVQTPVPAATSTSTWTPTVAPLPTELPEATSTATPTETPIDQDYICDPTAQESC